MTKQQVAYLHMHTVFSELDGIATSDEYAIKIKEINENSSKYEVIAMSVNNHGHVRGLLTDHDNLTNIVKYIPGMEVYHNCNDYVSKSTKAGKNLDSFHLVLYAKNNEGLGNLYKIATLAGKNKVWKAYKYSAISTEDILKQYGKGIIASTACLGSVFWELIKNNKYELAKKKLIEYSSYFDELYLEIQPHEHPDQISYNSTLIQLSNELNLPIVIGSDSHYINANQIDAYDALSQIRLFKSDGKSSLDDENNKSIIMNVKSFEEIEEFCIKYGVPVSAIHNTKVIADSCNVKVYPDSSKYFLPKFDVPDGYTEKNWLRKKVNDGLVNSIRKHKYTDIEERVKRINYELDVIHHTGYDGYFLLVSDIINDARRMGIPMGPGRGSGAGALVNYSLGVTNIDPISNGFLFSRFMTKERTDDPDIDSDVPRDERAKMLKHINNKYGSDKTAQIITYSKYSIKKLLTDSSKSFGLSNTEAQAISKKLPADMSYVDIENAYKDDSILKEMSSKEVNEIKQAYEELQELFKKYPKVEIALRGLKNVISNTGCHAGGVCITGIDLFGELPTETAMSDAPVLQVTQFDMVDISKLHIVKLDLLGLATLDKIKKTMDMVGLGWDWYDSQDYSDPNVYEHMKKGFTTQVFQLESAEPTRMLSTFNASSLLGITDVTSANRPGALAPIDKLGGKSMVDIYELGVKETLNGLPLSFTWGIKEVDDYLAPTYRAILYQEQLMELSRIIAGYNDGDSDKRIRKPMAKLLSLSHRNV